MKHLDQSPARTSVKTILIVEDDPAIGDFLMQVIAQETSYHAFFASTAFEALKIVEQIKPSLVLLDYTLPQMNGLQLYDEFQKRPHMQNIPVLFLSATLPVAELAKRGIEGMSKPVDIDVLLDALDRILERST